MKFAAVVLSTLFAASSAFATDKPDILEVMTIDGVISDYTATQVAKQVEQINENKRVKGVLLVVDSPGGGVLPSAVIYEELAKLSVPVVGYCQNICASGGMYVLMSPKVKYIGVRSSTISGSIGVIMGVTRYNRLLDWAKIDSETYKSGSSKDFGSGSRAVQPGEAEELQGMVNELAGTFYSLVGKARPKLTEAQWKEIKAAKIFFGKKGVEIGLVDQVMTREEAEKKAKDLSGSKLIFTRTELKKMSKDSEDRGVENVHETPAPSMLGDIPWIIETLKEIKAGTSVVIEYRLPYKL